MEKRRKAMLEMPKLIKAWKRVRLFCFRMVNQSFIMLTLVIDGKTQLDKVAEINGKRFYANARFMYIYTMYSPVPTTHISFSKTP
jgi:hypothetical protein